VHASWLLEHVPQPQGVVSEVHRVLRPGGSCQFLEVDNRTLVVYPEGDEVLEVMELMDRAQIAAGGDPYIGPKLATMFRRAGFSRVLVRPFFLGGDAEWPGALRELAEEFADIFESADEALGPALAPRLQNLGRRLRALPEQPGGCITYTASLLNAWK
jgi:hypothetical protein